MAGSGMVSTRTIEELSAVKYSKLIVSPLDSVPVRVFHRVPFDLIMLLPTAVPLIAKLFP